MTDLANRKGSVTLDDYLTKPDAGVWAWSIIDPGAMQSPVPQLPAHGTPARDRVLTATLDLEDMWASAVNKAVTKIANSQIVDLAQSIADPKATTRAAG